MLENKKKCKNKKMKMKNYILKMIKNEIGYKKKKLLKNWKHFNPIAK